MAGSGKGQERLAAFHAERGLGGREAASAFSAPQSAAAARLSALAQYRRARRRAAGFAPVEGGRNWTALGPFAVRRGQAATKPVVSGRVRGIAVSDDGRRVYVASANGGVWRSLDSGRTWRPMSDELELPDPATRPPHRHVDSLSCGALALVDRGGVDSDLLYVGTGEGTARRGEPETGYLGAGMLRSPDGGRTWQREGDGELLIGHGVNAVAVDPDDADHAVAATTRGIFRRQSAGTGWVLESPTALPGARAFTGLTVTRVGADTVWLASTADGRVVRSTGTAAWVPVTTPPSLPGSAPGRVTLACGGASSRPVVYALACRPNESVHGLHRIDLSAATPRWRTVGGFPSDLFGTSTIGFQGLYDQALAVDPADPDRVYVGGSTIEIAGEYSGAVYRCVIRGNAAGTSFTSTNTMIGSSVHGDIHVLAFRPGSSAELWLGCDGGVFAASDARTGRDRLFESRNTGLCTLTLMGLAHYPDQESYVFCGAQDNGGLRWLGGDVWDHQLYGDGGATVLNHRTRLHLLSGYVNADVRRAEVHADVDGPRYARTMDNPPGADDSNTLFYPPMAGAPDDGDVVVFGGHRPYVSRDFGDHWQTLPFPRTSAANAANPVPGVGRIRALVMASATTFYAGWDTGHLTRYSRDAAGTWRGIDLAVPDTPPAGGPPGRESRPVTGIAIDRRDASGRSVFITLGGRTRLGPRVRHLAAGGWQDAAGVGAEALLDIQHNAVVVDPDDHRTLYAAADLGVWEGEITDAGIRWHPLEGNLPDTAVLDLDLLRIDVGGERPLRLLRASTHGRGVFEMRLDRTQPPVELLLRANPLDQRHRPEAQETVLPGERRVASSLTESPDVFLETPLPDGRYTLPGDRAPLVTELVELPASSSILASEPGTPAVTRVHVVVRNRGYRVVDDVRVSLLVGPRGRPLPASYRAYARGGSLTEEDGWKAVGSTTAHDLVDSRPAVATFALSSELLPPLSESRGDAYLLVALLHHASDAFPDDASTSSTDPEVLARRCRSSALRRVTVASGEHRAAPSGGTGLVAPLSTTLLAHERLAALVSELEAKVTAAGPAVSPVERRVLAMAKVAKTGLESGPRPQVPTTQPGHAVGSYALLGALGFELPSYTSALLPGGTWVAETLRRGTGDPHLSRVAVPSTELPFAVVRSLLPGTPAATRDAVRAFASGLLGAAACGVLLAPQLADLLARDTNADWSSASTSRGSRAMEHHLRERYLGGLTTPVAGWLPPAAQVPDALWQHYLAGIEESSGLPARRQPGFGAFEAEFDAGHWLDSGRLGRGYGLLLDDARTVGWGFWPWFGLVLPVFAMPTLSYAIARELPHAGAFVDGGELGERAVFEAVMLSAGLGSLAPSLYSMLLWSKVHDHTEAFATALVMGLVRLGLVGTALATSGDESQSAAVRWAALFPPVAAADAYAAFRAALDPGRHPGNAKVFGLQTLPALTGLTTLGLLGVARAINGDEPTDDGNAGERNLAHGLVIAVSGVLGLVGAAVTALALSGGGGWRSWFLHDTSGLPVLSAVAGAGTVPLAPTASARVYADDQLWGPPGAGADVDQRNYPAGARPLVRVWWEGEGELRVRISESNLTFRHGAADQVVELPATPTATAIAEALQAGVPGLRAEVIGRDEPAVPVPRPRSLSDLGDAAPHEAAEALRTGFVRVPTRRGQALVLRQSPRIEQSTTAGRLRDDPAPYPVTPTAGATDDLGTGIRDAADLATLLLVAAAPSLGTVTVRDARPALPDPVVGEVRQVFRKWNLDERRLDEWRSLMTGHGGTAPPADPVRDGQNVMIRRQPDRYAAHAPGRVVAEAMGWLPLWRAWLRIAADPDADVLSDSQAGNPEVTLPGQAARPVRNRELTDGVRFLLDLGAT